MCRVSLEELDGKCRECIWEFAGGELGLYLCSQGQWEAGNVIPFPLNLSTAGKGFLSLPSPPQSS